MNEDKKGKMKVLFPDDIETITISKNDYDRLYGDLTYQNMELQQENAQLKNKLKDIEKILKSNHNVEYIYCALSQYLDLFDYELDLEDYLKEN